MPDDEGGPPAGPSGDPRPLRGEPLGLDLVNTVWVADGATHDLFATRQGCRAFLDDHELKVRPARHEAAAMALLREARDAIRTHLEAGSPATVRRALDRILARGALRPCVEDEGIAWRPVFDGPEAEPAWQAVRDYLELVTEKPQRVRRCSGAGCVLYFYDKSRRGDRQWCSMAGCGNRAKAARHYARVTEAGHPAAQLAEG